MLLDSVAAARLCVGNSAMTVFDVSIVGAGPAGAALATHLAGDGYSVLLLERGRFPRDKVCGDLVSAKGLKMLAELGCYAEIERSKYQPLQTASAYLEGELLVTAPLPTLPGHPPFGHTIPRLQLDEMIFRRAVTAGAHAVESCTVVDYNVDRSLVTIAAEVEGQRRAFESRVIVGADGAGSVVARRAGLEMRDPRHVQLAMRSYCKGLRLDAPIIFFTEEFFPGYGWAFPVNDALVNVGVGMVKESAQRDHLTLKRFYARFIEFVRRKALEAGVAIELTPGAGWPIRTYGGAKRNYFEHGLLIGDAGCFVDPISGEGIPLALRSASIAAETIRGAFAEGAFGLQTMSGFERRWRDHYDVDLGLSDLVVTLARNRRLVKLWMQCLRVIGMTASRDREYARTLGGVLAGLVPCRDALSIDVFVKSLVHGPAFWIEAFGRPGETPALDLLRRGPDLFMENSKLALKAAKEVDWIAGWASEVAAKQLKLAGMLLATGRKR
jgi:geranylgeranyl reductase family protein